MQIQRYTNCDQLQQTQLKNLEAQTHHVDIRLQQLCSLKLSAHEATLALIALKHGENHKLAISSKAHQAYQLLTELKFDHRGFFATTRSTTERYKVGIGYLQLVAANISGSVTGHGSGGCFSGRQYYVLTHIVDPANLTIAPRFKWNNDYDNYTDLSTKSSKTKLSDGLYRLRSENGNVFEGKIVKNKLVQGRYYYTDGSIYQGNIYENKMHGLGELYSCHGSCYIRTFKHSKFDGDGILYYANGNRYEGKFVNDNCHGQGTMYYANGQQLTTLWHQGQIIQAPANNENDALSQAHRDQREVNQIH